jgi:hypothetical protein
MRTERNLQNGCYSLDMKKEKDVGLMCRALRFFSCSALI